MRERYAFQVRKAGLPRQVSDLGRFQTMFQGRPKLTILVSQTVGITVSQNSTATLEATLWGSGAWANQDDLGGNGRIITGTVNYWGDPAFVSPTTLDYHIKANSDAIDRGINAGVTIDIDNQPRPNPDTGIPDLGADEYWISIPIYLPFILQH
jgi:hypothetical protein